MTMAEGDAGYVLDTEYLHNFLAGLAPLNLAMATLLSGVRPPDVDARFAYLDLGCGNGVTPALIAAANPQARVWGNDFNPAHIRNARATAAAAGIDNATFVEASFADLLDDAALPMFDIVVAHGIWSWVGDANRDRIAALLARALKPGGIAVVSYNCHPGWDATLQLRRLMASEGGAGTPTERIDRALATARRLRDAGAGYFRDNPAASRSLDTLDAADRQYLAHEHLNVDWAIFHPRDVAAALAPAGLTYVGQAQIVDNLDAFHLTDTQRAIVADAPDTATAQGWRDLILNRRYRRDVFVRDGVAARAEDVAAWFVDRRFALVRGLRECPLDVKTRDGVTATVPPLCSTVLDALAAGVATTDQLAAQTGADSGDLRAALTVLAAMGHVQPALPLAGEAARRIATDRFNDAALAAARSGEPAPALASPVTGSGVAVSIEDQLRLDAYRFGVRFGDGDRFEETVVPVLATLAIV